MAKAKEEQIFIGDNDQVIELIGTDKEAFLYQRAQDQIEATKIREEQTAQIDLKKSVYAKLGLTEEEINAIL